MSVLCNWRGYWALCGRVDAAKDSCFISGGPWLPSEEAYPTLSRRGKTMVHGSVSQLADVVFYPLVRYHGLKVSVSDFYHTDDQPRLICHADPRSEELRRGGWDQLGKGEYEKIVHVDDLEKIEGPPPDDLCFKPELRERIRAARMIRRGRWWTEPYVSPGVIDQPREPLDTFLTSAAHIFLVSDLGRPYSPRLGVAEWSGAALLFTNKEHAVLDARIHGPHEPQRDVALITMTPQEVAKYLRDLQQVSAEQSHPITRVLVNRSSGGHVIDLEPLCLLIETRGMTPR